MEKKSRTDVLDCPVSKVMPLQMFPAALRRLEAFYEENNPKPTTANAKAAMKNGRYGWPIRKGVFANGKYKDEPL